MTSTATTVIEAITGAMIGVVMATQDQINRIVTQYHFDFHAQGNANIILRPDCFTLVQGTMHFYDNPRRSRPIDRIQVGDQPLVLQRTRYQIVFRRQHGCMDIGKVVAIPKDAPWRFWHSKACRGWYTTFPATL